MTSRRPWIRLRFSIWLVEAISGQSGTLRTHLLEGREHPATGMRIPGKSSTSCPCQGLEAEERRRCCFQTSLGSRLDGDGDFPAERLLSILSSCGYQRFISFEWEKKWYPQIPDPEIALPQFARWARKTLAAGA